MKLSVVRCLSVSLLSIMVLAGRAQAGEWRVPVGVSTASGFNDIVDLHEDNLRAEGFLTESVEGLPFGFSARPYYRFDSGLGIGAGLGPAMIIFGDEVDFTSLPVSVSVRYALSFDSGVMPYVRAGILEPGASGDYVVESRGGSVFAIGMEFLSDRTVGFGIEFAVSDAEIEFEDLNRNGNTTIEPFENSFSIYAVF